MWRVVTSEHRTGDGGRGDGTPVPKRIADCGICSVVTENTTRDARCSGTPTK